MSRPKKKNPKAMTNAFSEKQKLFANLEPFSFFLKIFFLFLEAYTKVEVFSPPFLVWVYLYYNTLMILMLAQKYS